MRNPTGSCSFASTRSCSAYRVEAPGDGIHAGAPKRVGRSAAVPKEREMAAALLRPGVPSAAAAARVDLTHAVPCLGASVFGSSRSRARARSQIVRNSVAEVAEFVTTTCWRASRWTIGEGACRRRGAQVDRPKETAQESARWGRSTQAAGRMEATSRATTLGGPLLLSRTAKTLRSSGPGFAQADDPSGGFLPYVKSRNTVEGISTTPRPSDESFRLPG